LLMGKAYYQKGEYVRARDKFEALELFYPDSRLRSEGAFYRGLCYIEEKNYGFAVAVFNELAERDSRYKEVCNFKIGLIYFLQQEYSKVIEHYKSFLNYYPRSRYRVEAWSLMGKSAFEMKDYNSALNYYYSALNRVKIREQAKEIKLNIIQCQIAIKDYENGLRSLKDATEPEFLIMKAKILNAAGKKDEQLKLLMSLSKDQLTNELMAEVFCEIGSLYKEKNAYDSALIYFDSAYARSSTSLWGENSIKCKQTINKILEYQALSKEDPARAQFLLAELYFVNLSDTNRALSEYEKVYREYPKSEFAPKAMYAWAWIQEYFLKQDSIAKASYRLLIEKYPNTEYSNAAREKLRGQ
ncbi:MAG: tetratricopeptide repeat protein, partial [candidate division WOR-3 bacterium]